MPQLRVAREHRPDSFQDLDELGGQLGVGFVTTATTSSPTLQLYHSIHKIHVSEPLERDRIADVRNEIRL